MQRVVNYNFSHAGFRFVGSGRGRPLLNVLLALLFTASESKMLRVPRVAAAQAPVRNETPTVACRAWNIGNPRA